MNDVEKWLPEFLLGSRPSVSNSINESREVESRKNNRLKKRPGYHDLGPKKVRIDSICAT